MGKSRAVRLPANLANPASLRQGYDRHTIKVSYGLRFPLETDHQHVWLRN